MDEWTFFRCRRCAVFGALFFGVWLVAAMACGEGGRAGPTPVDAGAAESTLAEELTRPAPGTQGVWAARYYDGYLAETLRGDVAAARQAYEDVIAEAGAVAPWVAARAALRLAELEVLAGRRRKALELMARASVLGRDSLEIVERADRLQARLGSLRFVGSDVRGPPLGTALEGVSGDAVERFQRAEDLMAAYYRVRLEPRLEQLRAGVRVKESAMDAAVRAYRQVVAMDEPVAAVAAEFRIASLYHDLALALMFELPPELEPRAAAQVRRSLRASALGYLSRAQAAYLRSRAAGSEGGNAASERWLVAAELGLRSVDDLLGGRE